MYKSQRESDRVISKSVEQVSGRKRKRTIVRRRINAGPIDFHFSLFLFPSLLYSQSWGERRTAKSTAVGADEERSSRNATNCFSFRWPTKNVGWFEPLGCLLKRHRGGRTRKSGAADAATSYFSNECNFPTLCESPLLPKFRLLPPKRENKIVRTILFLFFIDLAPRLY